MTERNWGLPKRSSNCKMLHWRTKLWEIQSASSQSIQASFQSQNKKERNDNSCSALKFYHSVPRSRSFCLFWVLFSKRNPVLLSYLDTFYSGILVSQYLIENSMSNFSNMYTVTNLLRHRLWTFPLFLSEYISYFVKTSFQCQIERKSRKVFCVGE